MPKEQTIRHPWLRRMLKVMMIVGFVLIPIGPVAQIRNEGVVADQMGPVEVSVFWQQISCVLIPLGISITIWAGIALVEVDRPGLRRWLRISIRGALVAVTVLCILLGLLASEVRKVHKQRRAVAWVKEHGLTPAIIVTSSELQSLLDSGSFADISDPTLASDAALLPRISHEIEGFSHEIEGLESGGYDAVFVFEGIERRVQSYSGQVSVLSNGDEFAVVDEEQCGTPVRIVKFDKAGKTLFEVSEYCHAHSRVCYSPMHALIFIFTFEPSEIRAYSWANGERRFTIHLPDMQSPLMVITRDEQFLYVQHGRNYGQASEPTVRKYSVSDLLQSGVVSDSKASTSGGP